MLERKSLSLEIKTDAQGVIEGYGSVFGGKPDSYGDVIEPGAFQKSISKRRPVMLWQHDMGQPVGVWDEVTEDARGLRVKGRLAMETVRGAEAYALAKMGAVDGLSIGFRTVGFRMDGDTRVLTEIDLPEISIVTIPAADKARMRVKSVRDFEAELRDMGFSRTAAKAIAGFGKGWIGHCDDDPPADDGALRDAEAVKAALQLILKG